MLRRLRKRESQTIVSSSDADAPSIASSANGKGPNGANGATTTKAKASSSKRGRGPVTNPSSATSKTLAALRAHPRAPIADLATAVYGGEDEPSRGKIRSNLQALKGRNEARMVESGIWEAVENH